MSGLIQAKAARDRALKQLAAAKSAREKEHAIEAIDAAASDVARFQQRLEARRGPPQAAPPPKLRVVKPAAVAPPPPKPIVGYRDNARGGPMTAIRAGDEPDDEEEEEDEEDDQALDLDPDDDDDDETAEPARKRSDMDQETKALNEAAAEMVQAKVKALQPKGRASAAYEPIDVPKGVSAEELADAQAACDAAKARALRGKVSR